MPVFEQEHLLCSFCVKLPTSCTSDKSALSKACRGMKQNRHVTSVDNIMLTAEDGRNREQKKKGGKRFQV